MEKIDIDSVTQCWNWTGAETGNGYGLTWRNGRHIVAHRAAYELWRERVPNGLELDHLCKNKKCVNPAHLEIVTHSENSRRAFAIKKTHCKRGHIMSPDNTYVRKNGSHQCRTCQTKRHALFRHRRKTRAAIAKAQSAAPK